MKKEQFQPLTPAALYARVSSDRQDVDLSVAAQLRALRDYARNNDHTVAREYGDETESGGFTGGPQFLDSIEEGVRPIPRLRASSVSCPGWNRPRCGAP